MEERANLLGQLIITNAMNEAEQLIKNEVENSDSKAGKKEVVWRKSKGTFKSYIRAVPQRDSNKIDVWYNKRKQFKKVFYSRDDYAKCLVYLPEINFKTQGRTAYIDKSIEKALKEWQNYYGFKTRKIDK